MAFSTSSLILATTIFFLIIILPSTNASVEDLIQSYNFDFNLENSLTITNQTDYMLDTNNNGAKDTLFFNLSTNAITKGLYHFYIDLEDNNNLLTTKVSKNITQGPQTITLNFSTHLLSNSQFNYSIKIYNQDNMIVLKKFKQQTKIYPSYETNFKILQISDENINNGLIRIHLTINSTKDITKNLTLFLVYNNKTIQSTKEIILYTGQNNIYLDFNDQTIKSTHYNGKYTLNKINIGEKIINSNYTTAQYNFEDFAKTSYIKSYSDTAIDSDNNTLIDYLQINFTLNIKQKDTYKLEYQLYDLSGNFIASNSVEKLFDIGINTIETKINGSEIYKSKISTPYKIKFASIKNSKGEVIDERINSYILKTQNLSYTEFERPPQPDLIIDIKTKYQEPNNLINITVHNIGNSPAFNIFIDVFDNKTYHNQTSHFMLDAKQTQTFNFIANNISNNTIFTAVVDFNNLIDESNETNNIINNLDQEEIIIPNDTKKFYIRDLLGNQVAWFGNLGNIILKGICIISDTCIPPENSFIISNNTDPTAYIDNEGNLCLEKGDCNDQSLICNPTKNAFIIKNSTNSNMSYIDSDGELCLTGKLFQNSEVNL